MNKAGPKISIITVCFNAESTVEESIRSVSSQDWPYIEHIVIDGKSADNTMEVVNRHKDGLSAIVSEKDEGIYDAMNKGLRLATGDIVAFLNADDMYYGSDSISSIMGYFSDATIDAVCADVVYVDKVSIHDIKRHYRSNFFSIDKIGSGWMPAHPALFVRRHVFLGNEFNPTFAIAGDFEFVARVFPQEGFRFIHAPLITTRMRVGGASAFGWRTLIQVNKEIMRACKMNGVNTSYFRLLSRYPRKFLEKLVVFRFLKF